MKLKIAICDDEQKQIEYLSGVVSAWANKNRHVVELKTYSSAKSFLFDYSEEKDFDILLLDIEMPGMTGVDLAKTVRKENSTVQIVFITGYYEYFSDGFDVSALHYLIKPADERKLLPVLDRAVSNLNYRQRAVLLTSPDGDVKVSLADICYVESENVHVAVHTVSGVYRSRISLAKFAEQLDETFIKVHRSYIVGLKYVKKISRTDITMLNGDLVPISRGMYDEVHAALIKYLEGKRIMLFDKLIAKKVAAAESEILKKHYAEVENMYNKMRGWRHDYRSHIQTMKVHAKNGEYEEIDRYLDMLDDDLTHVETVIKTGNKMADAILNSKLSIATSKNIKVKAEARIPVSLTISELDLCIVIGNLLDNAIEACSSLPEEERLIRIYMEMKGNYLYLSLTNTAEGAKKHSFKTTKGEGHGLGLARIDAIVKKYGGYLTRASEDGAFSTEVLLPQ